MRMLTTVFAALSLAACATIPVAVREDGFARLGESTRAGPLIVRADKVVEDSRCPMNARCVWAGRVVLTASITENGRTEARNLVLGEPALTAGGEVMLDSVEPPTRTDVAIRPGDYRFHFSYRER